MKSIRVQGLHHKVQRIHFIAVQGHLRQVGHKNQQDTGIGFSKLTGGIHAVHALRKLDVQKHDVKLLLKHHQKLISRLVLLY